jgi:hypothetical protein
LSAAISILVLHGDAEAQLLAEGETAIQALFGDREINLVRAWATRPDWLDPTAPAPPAFLAHGGGLPCTDPRALLEQPHRLVIFSLLPAVSVPALRHRSGGVFLAHRGLRASWSPEMRAAVASECSAVLPLSSHDSAMALEPVIERLQARGSAVAVCTAFRHVKEPLEHRAGEGAPALREVIRRMNLEVAHLSRRTGCFVLDLDRPLAQAGGAALNADCFGGNGRAAEIALEEFAALVLDAVPDDVVPPEVT